MKFLSIYLGSHDSNISMSIGTEVRYSKAERIRQVKHAMAWIDFITQMCEIWGHTEFDAIVYTDSASRSLGTSIDIDQPFNRADHSAVGIIEGLEIKGGAVFCLDHHYSHLLSGFPLVPMRLVDYGVAIDGRGSNLKRKQVMTNLGTKEPKIVYSTTDRQFTKVIQEIGEKMSLAGQMGGLRQDWAGKVMGAQSYGTIDYDFVDSFNLGSVNENPYHVVHQSWRGEKIQKHIWRRKNPERSNLFFNMDNLSFRDWMATVHHAMNMSNLDFFQKHFHPTNTIIYSGGGVQNVMYNQTLYEHFPNLHFTPHGYDGGLSLGGIEFLRIYYDQPEFDVTGFPFWQHDVIDDTPSDETIERVAGLLEEGKIVGWYQGRGEIGPRALGHRSILMDPRIPEAKRILNETVKYREWFRPYAASILESAVGEYFADARPSSYMMRGVRVREGVKEIVPAVVHVDDTCRLQTVSDESQEPFALLLKKWHRRTGMPMLLNTSLNFKGAPIVGSSERAFELFETEGLDAICVGKELRVK